METEDEIDVHVEAAVIPMKLKSFVSLTMDVASASPRRYFFEARIQYVFLPLVSITDLCRLLFNQFNRD